jgi:DNA-binding MarR family transcriptional regulator
MYIQRMSAGDDVRPIARAMRRDCLAMCVRRLNRRLTRVYDTALRPHGVNTAQLNLLVAIGLAGAARQSEIARALGLERSTLSRNLDRLVGQGWVEVVRGETGAGQKLRLLPAGRRLVRRAHPAWREAQRQASADIQADLIEALTRAARTPKDRRPAPP